MGKSAIKRRASGGCQRTVLQRKHIIEKKAMKAHKREHNEERSLQARGLKKKCKVEG